MSSGFLNRGWKYFKHLYDSQLPHGSRGYMMEKRPKEKDLTIWKARASSIDPFISSEEMGNIESKSFVSKKKPSNVVKKGKRGKGGMPLGEDYVARKNISNPPRQ